VADGTSGVLVDGHDPEDYARVFERIIDAPNLRAALSVGAVAQAADFSWDRTADATVEVYARAIDLMAAEVVR
jgi:D-inositol-3-phosphate glycosyltransferase